ncbi:hypothetical protein MRB53_038237 [Persea americana]|nr:hypothetical protein MRB53_038237 [Persea americana]
MHHRPAVVASELVLRDPFPFECASAAQKRMRVVFGNGDLKSSITSIASGSPDFLGNAYAVCMLSASCERLGGPRSLE